MRESEGRADDPPTAIRREQLRELQVSHDWRAHFDEGSPVCYCTYRSSPARYGCHKRTLAVTRAYQRSASRFGAFCCWPADSPSALASLSINFVDRLNQL